MNKQAKEDYQNLWNEFIEVLPTLVKMNGAARSAKEYTRKLSNLFANIFETTDENPIQTVENHPLEAFEMLKQMQNSQPHAAPDNDDPVNNPSHYQSLCKDGIDCITAMRHAFGDEEVAIFCKLNAFKYNWRANSKGKNIDIGKAIWYLNKYLELNK